MDKKIMRSFQSFDCSGQQHYFFLILSFDLPKSPENSVF